MKHARDDYNRIQDPAGLIPADEPVFLLRGQDKLAIKAMEAYNRALVSEGLRLLKISRNKKIIEETKLIYEGQAEKLFDMSTMVIGHIKEMMVWQVNVKRKTPDV